MMISLVPSKAKTVVVSGTHAEFSAGMINGPNQFWAFSSSTNCWIAQSNSPSASAGAAGNSFVGAGRVVYLDGRNGSDVSVVQDTAGGKASLTPVTTY